MDASPVATVRGYELFEPVGAGGFSVVYRANQPGVGRQVAVKVIRSHLVRDQAFFRRFEAEAQLIARLEHLHIVPLYDYWCEPNGDAYLVMRWMAGGSLRQALERGPWTFPMAGCLLAQVVAALTLAHGQGVVHRDLKPGNILLDDAGNAFLSDFGIAKDFGQTKFLTQEGAVVGTTAYMAPEQIRAEPVTIQTDIYSLGVVLFELITGRHPFPEAGLAQMLVSHLQKALPPLTSVSVDLLPQLDAVIQQATAKDPAHRFADAQSFLDAFCRATSRYPGAEVGFVATAAPRSDRKRPRAAPEVPTLAAIQSPNTEPIHGDARLQIRLLGQTQLKLDARILSDGLARKAQAMTYYLAVAGESQTRPSLAAMLWSNFSDERARANLRDTLSLIRRTPLKPFFDISRHHVGFNPETPYWLDTAAFAERVATGIGEPGRGAAQLAQAVSLYSGEFLPGFHVAHAPLFDDWVYDQRQEFEALNKAALGQLVEYHLDHENYSGGAVYAARLLDLDPWSESAHRSLMLLHFLNGDASAAIRQYDLCRQILADELGVAPDEKTEILFRNICSPKANQAKGAMRRSGNDLPKQAPIVHHNIPGQATAFIGREKELRALDNVLGDRSARMVTIFGVGGIGKTRLALATAERQAHVLERDGSYRFQDGVFFVPLDAVETASEIVPALCQALKFQPLTDARSGRSARQQLLDHLRSRQLLIILDNFEHLLEGAGLLSSIQRAAPGVHLLVTSRQKLALHGERLYALQGLPYPETDTEVVDPEQLLTTYPAAALFEACAQRVRAEFELTKADVPELIKLCRLVDGLPLAVELAAGWMNVLSLADIVAEVEQGLAIFESDLHDLPERHQDMVAVFDVSWRRLTESEKRVFSSLCVFRGGFERNAADEVVGATYRQLAALIDKALIQYDMASDRYHIHRLLRQFGAAKLAGNDAEEAILGRHCGYFCGMIEDWDRQLRSSGQLVTLTIIENESANAQAAWAFAARKERFEDISRALDGLSRAYLWRRRLHDGEAHMRQAKACLIRALDAANGATAGTAQTTLEILLARMQIWESIFCDRDTAIDLVFGAMQCLTSPHLAAVDTRRERAFGLRRAGDLAFDDDSDEAQRHYLGSLDLYRELADEWGMAKVLTALGWVAAHRDEKVDSHRFGAEALALTQTTGDRKQKADALWLLGTLAITAAQTEDASRLLGESLDLRATLGDRITDCAVGPLDLGMTLTWIGRLDQAHSVREEALTMYKAQGQPEQIGRAHMRLATSKMHIGQFEGAERHARKGLALCREVGDYRGIGLAELIVCSALDMLNQTAEVEALCRRSITRFARLDGAAEAGWACGYYAVICGLRGRVREARAHIARAIRSASGVLGIISILHGLTAYLIVLAEEERYERMIEIKAMLDQLPLFRKSRAYLPLFTRQLVKAEAALTPGQVFAATNRGKARDWYGTAAEVLAELEEAESVTD